MSKKNFFFKDGACIEYITFPVNIVRTLSPGKNGFTFLTISHLMLKRSFLFSISKRAH